MSWSPASPAADKPWDPGMEGGAGNAARQLVLAHYLCYGPHRLLEVPGYLDKAREQQRTLRDLATHLRRDFGQSPRPGEVERVLLSDARTRLLVFYAHYAPAKLHAVDALVADHCPDREQELWTRLVAKYGPPMPASDLFVGGARPAATPPTGVAPSPAVADTRALEFPASPAAPGHVPPVWTLHEALVKMSDADAPPALPGQEQAAPSAAALRSMFLLPEPEPEPEAAEEAATFAFPERVVEDDGPPPGRRPSQPELRPPPWSTRPLGSRRASVTFTDPASDPAGGDVARLVLHAAHIDPALALRLPDPPPGGPRDVAALDMDLL